MFLNNYPCTSSSFAHSRVFKGLSSAPAILLLHGFMGSPYDLVWIGKQLNEAGYTIYIPRLPGHGTNSKDFLASNWRAWLRAACDAYINISAMHESVFVAGHSMGGLLASLLAAHFNPEKLILFAPAFLTRDKRIALTPLTQFFIKNLPLAITKSYDEPDFQKAQKDYLGTVYVPKLVDLLKLMKLATKKLEYVKAETLIFLSEKDALVPLEVKDLLNEKLKAQKEFVVLQESSHALTDGVEREEVVKNVIEFLKI